MCVGPCREVQSSCAASNELQDSTPDTELPLLSHPLVETERSLLALAQNVCKGTLVRRRNQIILSTSSWIMGKSVGWNVGKFQRTGYLLVHFAVRNPTSAKRWQNSRLDAGLVSATEKHHHYTVTAFSRKRARERSSNNNKKGQRHTQPLRLIKSSLAFNKQFFEKKLMEKVTSPVLSRACHIALSHRFYKWNKFVAFLFISDALKGCITHWTLHFFPSPFAQCAEEFLVGDSVGDAHWAQPAHPTRPTKQHPRLPLMEHKEPCPSNPSLAKKKPWEREKKISSCWNGAVPPPAGDARACGTVGKSD